MTVEIRSFQKIMEQISAQSASRNALLSLPRKMMALLGFTAPDRQVAPALKLTGPMNFHKAPITAPEFSSQLRHEKSIRKMRLAKWAPILVTLTDDGLFIWNTRLGQLIDHISDSVKDFMIFDQMGIVSYTTAQNKRQILYSVFLKQKIFEFEPEHYLAHLAIAHWQPGIAYITDSTGKVTALEESLNDENAGSEMASYTFTDTHIRLRLHPNWTAQTVVETANGKYFVYVYCEYSSEWGKDRLVLEVYNLRSANFVTGQRLDSKEYLIDAFQFNYKLSPRRDQLFYTQTESDTGIINFKKLLTEMNL